MINNRFFGAKVANDFCCYRAINMAKKITIKHRKIIKSLTIGNIYCHIINHLKKYQLILKIKLKFYN